MSESKFNQFKNRPLYNILFVTGIGLLCSFLLAGVSEVFRHQIQENTSLEYKKSILLAIGIFGTELPPVEKVNSNDINRFFQERILVRSFNLQGEEVQDTRPIEQRQPWKEINNLRKDQSQSLILPVFGLTKTPNSQEIDCWIIPVWGKGLWGPLYGFVVLEKDGTTVRNVNFSAPKETPGLGAEIESEKFRKQWQGKKIFYQGQLTPIQVVKGRAEDIIKGNPEMIAYVVDGISGATLTCQGVSDMIASSLSFYEPILKKLQKGDF